MTEALHIVCPHCQIINRVQSFQAGSAPECGHCHRALFTGAPVELDESSFDRHIQRNHIPVLVDFWAPWCGPCRTMAPTFAQAAHALEPWVRLAKLNTEDHPEFAADFNIRSIPTLALFRAGKELARVSGVMSVPEIVGWVRSVL